MPDRNPTVSSFSYIFMWIQWRKQERAWAKRTLWPTAGDEDLTSTNHSPPLPPPHQGKLGRHPPPPSRGHTPPPSKLLIWDKPRKNLTSASKSGSEVTVPTQDDHGEHFWLNGTSLLGQAAELVTSAEWPARYPKALPSSWRENPWQASTTRQVNGRPVRDRSLYKGSPCTFPPLSNKTRRWPHLQTHREEILPTRSEEEQTVVKNFQAKQLRGSSSLRL